MTVTLPPEPYRSALASSQPRSVCDLPAGSAEALYGRALARIEVGRDADARRDLEAALAERDEDLFVVERAYLDVRARRPLDGVKETLLRVLERLSEPTAARARALHVLGLVEGKRRRTDAAVSALREALDLTGALELPIEQARVHDTLGMVFAAMGRLDWALVQYGQALVGKALHGDRLGMAVTLGNVGRLHLREGRSAEALDAFRQDLALCVASGDLRGQARMHEDIGRALLALERFEDARDALDAALALAEGQGYLDLEVFALKDLALLSLAEGDVHRAGHLLDQAEGRLDDDAEPYLRSLLEEARGRWLLASGRPDAVDRLRRAAAAFRRDALPDLEVPTLLALTEALLDQGERGEAQSCLRRALAVARADGYARYLPRIREAMTRLALPPGLVEERGRLGADETAPASDGYLVLSHLGDGAFGSVERAYDPVSAREVAIKRLRHLDAYDREERERVLHQARTELEAAAESDHPGVARVFAIGTDGAGGTYVVLEFVVGRTLAEAIVEGVRASPEIVLPRVREIAWALDDLHARGVVHRDLKPANVVVREADGTPVLIDFGIAHVRSLEDVLGREHVVGTPRFMPPEQARGRAVDGRADVYALGVLAYQWLTGEDPVSFEEASLAEALHRIEHQEPRPLEELRPDVPAADRRLVHRMLSKDPARRPTAREVAEALARFAPG